MSNEELGILKRRAEELALPVATVHLRSGTHLAFPAGPERLAVALAHAVAVLPVGEGWARLPGAPAWIAGVLNVRGRLLPLTDLLPLLGLPAQEVTGRSHVAVVEAEDPQVLVPRTALLCSDRPAEIEITPEELGPPPETVPQAFRRFVAGVTPELITVLDVPRLLSDPLVLAGPGTRRERPQ